MANLITKNIEKSTSTGDNLITNNIKKSTATGGNLIIDNIASQYALHFNGTSSIFDTGGGGESFPPDLIDATFIPRAGSGHLLTFDNSNLKRLSITGDLGFAIDNRILPGDQLFISDNNIINLNEINRIQIRPSTTVIANMAIIINGVLIAENTGVRKFTNTTRVMSGKRTGDTGFYDGNLISMRISSTTHSEEILYTFNENTDVNNIINRGTAAGYDAVGTDLTLVNLDEIPKNVLQFNGTTSKAVMNTNETSFTANTIYFKMYASAVSLRVYLSFDVATIYTVGDTFEDLRIALATSSDVFTLPPGITGNTLYDFVLKWNGSFYDLHMLGNKLNKPTSNLTSPFTVSICRIGVNTAEFAHYTGLAEDVRVSSQLISDTEANLLSNGEQVDSILSPSTTECVYTNYDNINTIVNSGTRGSLFNLVGTDLTLVVI